MKNFTFELSKTKKANWVILNVAGLAQLSFLYFFTIVGHFETSDTDAILNNYSGLTGLATTITMCISAIYGTIVVNRLIVTNYIGDSRLRLYLYPYGRGCLYYTKNIVFVVSFTAFQLLGTFLANIIYVVGESFFPILVSQSPISTHLVDFVSLSIIGTLLTTSIVLLSSFAGIRFSSLVATIVTGIILIAMGGNLVAVSFANYSLLTFIASLFLSALVFVGVIITGIQINKDEVF